MQILGLLGMYFDAVVVFTYIQISSCHIVLLDIWHQSYIRKFR